MAQVTAMMPEGRQRYHNNDGTPCAGGKLYTYAAGTSNPKATYADADGTIQNPNPVPLDAHGEAVIFWTGAYKVDLKQSDGLQVTGYPVDNQRTDPAGLWNLVATLATSGGAALLGLARTAAGAVATTLAKWLDRQEIDVFDFMTEAQIADACSGAPVLDHTAAVQKVFNLRPRLVNFNSAGTFRVGVLQIKGACEIRGNGSRLLGAGLGIFNAVAALPFLTIHGFKSVAWVAGDAVGLTGRQFFWNGDNAAGSTVFGAATAYPITDLRIFDNVLGASKVECFGKDTVARVNNNNWVHAAGVSVAPAYLYLERGTTDDNAGPVYVENNHFDVYPPDGLGKSILKVGGGITDAQIHRNYVKNNNNACLAHVDVFTGAHKMRFTENTLIDVQLHRKQVKGSLPAAPNLYQYDIISGNMFDLRAGALTNTHIYFIGALGTITQNQFRSLCATVGYCVQLDPSDVNIGLDTNGPVGVIIANNIMDLRGAPVGNAAVKVAIPNIGASGSRFLVVSGNIVLGGTQLLQGGAEMFSAIIGNVWGYSSNSSGTSMNGGSPNNLMIGNVADSQVPVMTGGTSGNLVNLSIPTLAANASPDVSTADVFNVNSAVEITGFTGGYIGKRITIFNLGTGIFTPSNNLKLAGNLQFSFTTFGDSLTLMQTTAAGRWVEVGRCKNS